MCLHGLRCFQPTAIGRGPIADAAEPVLEAPREPLGRDLLEPVGPRVASSRSRRAGSGAALGPASRPLVIAYNACNKPGGRAALLRSGPHRLRRCPPHAKAPRACPGRERPVPGPARPHGSCTGAEAGTGQSAAGGAGGRGPQSAGAGTRLAPRAGRRAGGPALAAHGCSSSGLPGAGARAPWPVPERTPWGRGASGTGRAVTSQIACPTRRRRVGPGPAGGAVASGGAGDRRGAAPARGQADRPLGCLGPRCRWAPGSAAPGDGPACERCQWPGGGGGAWASAAAGCQARSRRRGRRAASPRARRCGPGSCRGGAGCSSGPLGTQQSPRRPGPPAQPGGPPGGRRRRVRQGTGASRQGGPRLRPPAPPRAGPGPPSAGGAPGPCGGPRRCSRMAPDPSHAAALGRGAWGQPGCCRAPPWACVLGQEAVEGVRPAPPAALTPGRRPGAPVGPVEAETRDRHPGRSAASARSLLQGKKDLTGGWTRAPGGSAATMRSWTAPRTKKPRGRGA
jgi:hypothetical protein